jgi:hypothetical protein
MFTLSATDAAVVGLGLFATIVVLVAGALRGGPRSSHVVTGTVHCPLLNRNVTADLEWDDWALRFIDVTRCSVLGACARTTCSLRCIRGLRAPGAGMARA